MYAWDYSLAQICTVSYVTGRVQELLQRCQNMQILALTRPAHLPKMPNSAGQGLPYLGPCASLCKSTNASAGFAPFFQLGGSFPFSGNSQPQPPRPTHGVKCDRMASRREVEDDSEEDFNPGNAEDDEDDEDYDANAAKKKQKRKSAFVDDAADDDDAVSKLPNFLLPETGLENHHYEHQIHRVGDTMQEDDEDDDDEDGDAPKRGQKRLKRSRFVDDIAAVDEEDDDEEEEVDAGPLKPWSSLRWLCNALLFQWMH